MTMDAALIYNRDNLDDFIGYSKCEEPLVVQLGGSDPDLLSEAAGLCDEYGSFEAINLNCGCPSTKAKSGCFGAEWSYGRTKSIWQSLSITCSRRPVAIGSC
jgi:tRNA-dihydrouridine synthase